MADHFDEMRKLSKKANNNIDEDINDIENVSDENQELKEINSQSVNYKTDNHENSSNGKKTNKCPNCGEGNSIENIYCQNCGEYLPITIGSEEKEKLENAKNIDFENIDENTVTIDMEKECETEPVVDYVICPNCSNNCSEDSDFCNKCGTKLKVDYKCPNCGIEFTDEDAFCKKCGTKLPQVPIKIYKQIDNKLYCPTCGTEYKKGDVFFFFFFTNLITNEISLNKSQKNNYKDKSGSGDNIKKCPFCGAENKKNEYFCGECGKSLSPNISQVRQNTVQEQNKKDSSSKKKNTIDKAPNQSYSEYNTVKCPYCGSKIQRYTKKCPNGFLMALTTIIAICMAIGGESIGIPFVGEIGGLWLIIVAFLYFLPALIAEWRGHDSKLAIFIVDLLFGWTFVGWWIALIFSFTGRSR